MAKELVSQFGRIGVLMGGCSLERNISIKSGKAVHKALLEMGCEAIALDIVHRNERDIKELIMQHNIDIAFIALHGILGEDGKIQRILDELEIPYTGSTVQASRLCIDKTVTQNILKNNNIQVPKYIQLKKDDSYEHLIDEIDFFPVVVKPALGGSSIGMSFVNYKNELVHALKKAWNCESKVMVEEYIPGREMTVGILENEALPVVEISPEEKFFDFDCKYQKGKTQYVVPADISESLRERVQQIAYQAHCILGCADFSRIDFIIDNQFQPYLLEINTIPGFTSTSLLPKAAAAKGVSFQELCLKLVELAYGKKTKTQGKRSPVDYIHT